MVPGFEVQSKGIVVGMTSDINTSTRILGRYRSTHACIFDQEAEGVLYSVIQSYIFEGIAF
jgi:hypothetical protein